MEIQEAFIERYQIPQALGVVNGTLIPILTPAVDVDRFFCQNGYAAIHCQAICDHQGLITDIVARWPGSTRNLFVFLNSSIGQQAARGLSEWYIQWPIQRTRVWQHSTRHTEWPALGSAPKAGWNCTSGVSINPVVASVSGHQSAVQLSLCSNAPKHCCSLREQLDLTEGEDEKNGNERMADANQPKDDQYLNSLRTCKQSLKVSFEMNLNFKSLLTHWIYF